MDLVCKATLTITVLICLLMLELIIELTVKLFSEGHLYGVLKKLVKRILG